MRGYNLATMKALLKSARRTLLKTPDTVCLERARLVTEAWREYAAEPVPIRRAKALARTLSNMTLDLETNPIFAGNTSSRPRAWMLLPEYDFAVDGQVAVENEGLAGFLDEKVPPDLRDLWSDRRFGRGTGIGHLAVDMHRVVHEGLAAVLAEARGYPHEADPAKRVYREAMTIALEAVIGWAARYADAAKAAARGSSDPARRAAHERVARACRQVPARPARDLFEGLQAMVLVHLAVALEGHGMSISIGLPDRVLAPFVDDDFDADEATDLACAFRLKLTANSLYGRGSKTQAITVGGADAAGRDCANALTRCFLEACDQVRVGDPHVFLRWHAGLDPQLKRRAMELLASGLSMPLLVHDEPTAGGLMAAGVAEEDAWEYCIIGCNELGIPGRSMESATNMHGLIQHLDLLNRTLIEHLAPDEVADMPALLAAVEETLADDARQRRREGLERRRRMAERVPTPFTSALMRGCIERGLDLHVGMDYLLAGHYERGLTNAANALAAIEKTVFEDRSLSLGELVAAMQSSFADESVRRRLLTAPRWGNDDPRVDRWAVELVAMRERVLEEVDREFATAPHVVCHVVRSLHHLDGRRIGASPDGRRAGTPVADSIGADGGTSRSGPTAILSSVLKLDAARYYRGGYNLNLTLPPDAAAPDILLALVEGFFGRGGQELQIAVLDAETLRRAQARPEEHPDLLVRVAGFNALFASLSTAEQDELIARAESAAT